MPPISFKDCDFTLSMPDGTTQVFKGHDAFIDHLLNDKTAKELGLGLELRAVPEKEPKPTDELTHEQKATDMEEAKALGFEHPAQALNSVNKRTGVKYEDLQSVPKDILSDVAQERYAEKIQEVHDIMKDGIGENPDTSTRKKVDDFFNSLKIDTKGGNLFALPIPPELINGVIEVIHQAVLGGMKLADGIQKGLEWLKEKGLEGDDLDFAHYRLREDTGMNRAPKMKVQDYLNDGRSDNQIAAYLKKEGIPKPVALAIIGDAKDHPIPAKERQLTYERAVKEHFKLEDQWMGNKDVAKFESQQEARAFQEKIQAATKEQIGTDGKKVDWKDVDRAIHISLDLERNPGHAKEFTELLTDKQAKILEMAQNLTPEQKQIAQDISTEYKKIGLMLKDQGIIKDVVEHYVSRAWDFGEGKGATDQFSKMKTNSRHSLQRTLDTILEGWAKGYNLKLEGASNNLQALKVEIANVIESKELIRQGLEIKFDTGDIDAEGKPMMKPLLTTKKGEPGYKPINSSYYKQWKYAGKLEDVSMEERKMFGNDTMVTEDGTVMKKYDLYAPEKIAESLNNILNKSSLADKKVWKDVTEINRALKTSILSFSGYHYFAFSRAHVLAGQAGKIANVNPITAYKAGLDMMAQHNPHLLELIKDGGLTIGRAQDFTEGMTEHLTWLDKQLDKAGWPGTARRKMVAITDVMHKHLFETYGAGLKSFDAINLFQKELAKFPNVGPAKRMEIVKGVSKVVNDTYGGINWERMHGSRMQDPTNRHVLSLTFLALDWTASNLRFSLKALKGGYDGQLYRRLWAQTLLRGATIGAVMNAGLSLMNDGDNTKTWEQKLADIYKRAWGEGRDSKANKNMLTKTASSLIAMSSIDLTPLYHAMGGDPEKLMYYPVFGAYTDILRATSDPIKFIDNKLAIVPKMGYEMLRGKDWQNKEYTSWDELFGNDDKGQYKRKYKNKKTGETYMPGDEKGGKLKGQLTKWDYSGGGGGLGWDQLPSFVLSQIRGSLPVSVQNISQAVNGERDWIYSTANMLGLGVSARKKVGAQK